MLMLMLMLLQTKSNQSKSIKMYFLVHEYNCCQVVSRPDSAILVGADGNIVAVGPNSEVAARVAAVKADGGVVECEIDCGGRAVIPGTAALAAVVQRVFLCVRMYVCACVCVPLCVTL